MACEPALAAELWRTVAGYLEFYELTRLATTNTDLRAVCDADELWARFALSWLVGAGLAPRQAAVFRETCLPRWRDAGVRPVVRKAASPPQSPGRDARPASADADALRRRVAETLSIEMGWKRACRLATEPAACSSCHGRFIPLHPDHSRCTCSSAAGSSPYATPPPSPAAAKRRRRSRSVSLMEAI